MNVGISLLTLFPGRVGGSETYIRGLLDAFSVGNGPELSTVLASRHSGPSVAAFAGRHVDIVSVGAYRPGNRRLTRAAAMSLARLSRARITRQVPPAIDLIHYPLTVPIPHGLGVPSVVSLADLQHRDLPEMFSKFERIYRRRAYDQAAQSADQVVTFTHFAAQRISAELNVEIDRIAVIPHGIDHARFTRAGADADIPGLPDRYIYFPANDWPHKNHRRLVAAFEKVADPSLSLVLTGQVNHWPEMRGANERIVHLGHVPAEQVAPLYRGAEAMIFPSLYEGFGLPPLEAMACGCPVAASNTGAVAEVCGDAALLFDPNDTDAIADAITRISGDATLRSSLIEAGVERAASFTWEQSARRHLAVYHKALAVTV